MRVSNLTLMMTFKHSLYNVHEMNAHRVTHVHPSVHTVQLNNHWMNFDEILYGHYAIERAIPNSHFLSSQIKDISMVDEQTCEVEATP
jgi:hypothetical protein